MTENEWSIILYREGNFSPVAEFIEGLDEKTQERITWSLERLRVQNVGATEPLVRHVEGKLWELREESRTNIYRLFYFMASGRRIVMLHGFKKKTRRTPRKEIEIALRRMNRALQA